MSVSCPIDDYKMTGELNFDDTLIIVTNALCMLIINQCKSTCEPQFDQSVKLLTVRCSVINLYINFLSFGAARFAQDKYKDLLGKNARNVLVTYIMAMERCALQELALIWRGYRQTMTNIDSACMNYGYMIDYES